MSEASTRPSDPGLTTSALLVDGERELVERMATLARERFGPRAADYDRQARFPHEDFRDIFAAGLHAPALGVEAGGLGLGPVQGRSLALWLMTREVARANLALARCWEGHLNALVLLDAMASPEQRARWFPGIVEAGDKWAAWSGEPLTPVPGQRRDIGTRVERVAGGWTIEGTKVFCSSAGAAQRAVLLVNTAGPGGVRHASAAADTQLALVCDLSDPSVSYDDSWWDPIGMRASVSHLARFAGTFIPDRDLLGAPGQYLREDWQSRFVPHYAASFLGAATAACDYALTYVHGAGRHDDPYVQQRVAKMVLGLDSGALWLAHVARLWDAGRLDEAKQAGSRARYLIEQLAAGVVEDAVHVCGARGLNRPSALERVVRDLTFYMRHDNDDHILANIGRAVLGQDHDLAFHR